MTTRQINIDTVFDNLSTVPVVPAKLDPPKHIQGMYEAAWKWPSVAISFDEKSLCGCCHDEFKDERAVKLLKLFNNCK